MNVEQYLVRNVDDDDDELRLYASVLHVIRCQLVKVSLPDLRWCHA